MKHSRRYSRKRRSRRSRRAVIAVVEGRRVRGHYRTIRLRNGRTVRMLVREHVRTGKHPHRLSSMPVLPYYQREMLDRWQSQTAAATSDQPDDAYISPEERAAQGYMDRQQRLLHRFRRGKL